MPLSITLGFTGKGRAAEPQVLYCGLDATAATTVCENPPAGIVRTEFIKAPLVTRRRFFEAPELPAEPVAAAEETPEPAPAPRGKK